MNEFYPIPIQYELEKKSISIARLKQWFAVEVLLRGDVT